MFTLAHISDLHLDSPLRPRGRQLMNKRLLGYLNWYRRRRAVHQRPVLDTLIADLLEQAPDHIAVTGDLVNLGLPGEFVAARAWLEALGPPDRVSVVPGNHDAYVKIPYEVGIGRWREYMHNDAPELHVAQDHSGFPFARIRGGVALIGLCSAVPTLPFMAAGRLGAMQLHALPPILDQLARSGHFRVLLVHHPPLPRLTGWVRGLRDVSAFSTLLSRHGAELVLYGHNHWHAIDYLERKAARLPAVCVPSASSGRPGGHVLARYNLYRISGTNGAWHCEMIGRGLLSPSGPVQELERIALTS